jgi:N6-adenosine-specific RNA methylase IME4
LNDVAPSPERALRLLEAGRAALAEARTIGDLKKIRDQAAAIKHYMSQQEMSREAQQDAAELKVRAERRLGELLADDSIKFHEGTKSTGPGRPKTLPEEITRKQSHRWQRAADVPDETFEAHVAECRTEDIEITTAGVMKLAKAVQKAEATADERFADGCTVEDLSALAAAGRTFGTIYADPPWQYGNQATRASTDNHYSTMTVEQIAALPVGDLAAPQSHLWLWTTNGFLFECPRLFAAWGFEFKSSYVWIKPQIGIGNYVRNSHEFLLLAVRGGLVGLAKDVRSWGQFDRTRHSAKPERIRMDVVEKVSPGPYLELFGRAVVPGWTVWGNQIDRGLFTGGQ